MVRRRKKPNPTPKKQAMKTTISTLIAIPALILSMNCLSAAGLAVVAQTAIAGPSVDELRGRFFTGPVLEVTAFHGPAEMPDSSRIGVQTHFNFQKPWFTPEAAMPFLEAAGVKWVRDGLNWKSIGAADADGNHPNPGAHDHWVHALDAAGIRILAPLLYGPEKNPLVLHSPEEFTPRYLDYCRFVLQRYGGKIRAIQIWNEPHNFGGWKTRFGGSWYGGGYVAPFARFTRDVSRALKRDFPELTIVGGTSQSGTLMQMLDAAKPALDAVYLHTYPRYNPPEILSGARTPLYKRFTTSDSAFIPAAADIRHQAAVLLENPELQLWVTETGAAVYPDYQRMDGDHLHHPPVTEQMQAKMTGRILMTAMASEVERIFIFILIDQTTNPRRANFGLVTHTHRPRPAYFTFARINTLTRGDIRPDPDFHAAVVQADPPPLALRTIETPDPNNPHTQRHPEEIRIHGFRRGDGKRVIAVWSDTSIPEDPDGSYIPRNAVLCVNCPLPENAVAVDTLTGESHWLKPDVKNGTSTFPLKIMDHPVLIFCP
jgi:hypothetical protein